MRVKVFYHFYIPPDLRAQGWQSTLDQQLKAIDESGLNQIATVSMHITMPKYWEADGFMPFKSNSTAEPILFFEKVVEYVSIRYPWVNILDIRDTGEANLYEGSTLKALYDSDIMKDDIVLYIHNKGVVSNSAHTGVWREVLNHYVITKWPACIKLLETKDVVGVRDLHGAKAKDKIVSGNFWWATGSYLLSLNNPLDVESYSRFKTGESDYRYAFELWVLSNRKVNVGHVTDTKVDHGLEYYFIKESDT